MGQKSSKRAVSTVDIDTKPKHVRKLFKSSKALIKAGFGFMRRKKYIRPASPCINVILPNACLMESSFVFQEEPDKKSRHSLLSYALSKLAIFSVSSRFKMKEKESTRKLTFHRRAPPVGSRVKHDLQLIDLDSNNNDAPMENDIIRQLLSPRDINKGESAEEVYRQNLEKFEKILACTVPTSSEEDLTDYFDKKYNYPVESKKKALGKPSRVIATSKNRVEVDTTFAFWLNKVRSNLSNKKVATRMKTHGSKKVQSAVDNNFIVQRVGCNFFSLKKKKGKDSNNNASKSQSKGASKMNSKANEENPEENVTYSRSNIRRSSYVRSTKPKIMLSTLMAKKSSSKVLEPEANEENPEENVTYSRSNTRRSSYVRSTKPKIMLSTLKAKKSSSRVLTPEANSRKPGRAKHTTSSKSPLKGAPPKGGNSRNRKPGKKSKSKPHSCAGKGCFPTAPPAYLDYGGSGAIGKTRPCRDVVMERIKNVDVVEELTYMVPNACENGDGGCEEEEDCDYYAVCESCGEMEPIPDELRRKVKGNEAKGKGETPVTYSRRQRFNFNNKGDEDDDGPPFPYEGLQCPTCRCMCCVAGLRRNPNCDCKCCQTMGNARRCNSFDEFPVGKNPEIRRILCPEEECKLIRDECDKKVPVDSGMYKYDGKKNTFERQVPRTPSPIIIEVSKPRPLRQHEVEAIAEGLMTDPRNLQCEAEPMYLPPIFGQCNPCYPPCCAPKEQDEKVKPGSKSTSRHGTKSHSTGKSS